MTAIIEVDSLTKRYGSKRGIIDVSFQVEEGEVFGFLGPNGAGKTTTIRTLMALLRADAGTARIAGLDVWQHSVEIKRLIGYLPGELSLDPNLTGGQILEYFGHLRGGIDQAIKDFVEVSGRWRRPRRPDPGVISAQPFLVRTEQGLVELFAAAQTREADLEVPFTQVELGCVSVDQIDDSNRISHIEDERLAKLRQAGRFDDQADSFLDCHEEARDVRMRNGHGFSVLDLLRQNGEE